MIPKKVVFLSYSRKDSSVAEELLVHLRPLERNEDIQIWHDKDINVGDDWREKIHEMLERADVAILLISADFLASEWAYSVELSRLLERHRQGKVRILPVIIRPASWVQTPLAYLQIWPRDGRALSGLPAEERDRLWADFTRILTDVLHEKSGMIALEVAPEGEEFESKARGLESILIAQRAESPRARDGQYANTFFISHAKEDGDFAENLKSRMAAEGLVGWIDIDVLEAGADWRKEIDEAILRSAALILILSPDSKASEYVTYEWAFGLGSGLRIVPILLRETPIHPRLEIFQYLDFTNRRARPWDRLIFSLKGLSTLQGAS